MYAHSSEKLITVRAASIYTRGTRPSAALYQCYRLHDYEGMLMFDHAHMIGEYSGPVPYRDIALDIAKNCPRDIKRRYLVKMLRIAYTLFGNNCISDYRKLMEELKPLIGDLPSPAMQRQFTGEWLLISALQYARYPEKLYAALTEAASYITESLVLDYTSPLFVDSTSILGAIFTVPGTVDDCRRMLALALPIYTALTGGGRGIIEFVDAEIAYYRCDLDTAYNIALKAQAIAHHYQQDILYISVTKLLAHIYKHRADTAGWVRSTANMERMAQSDPPNAALSKIVSTCLINELNCSISNTAALPIWQRAPIYSGFTELDMPRISPEGGCLFTTSTFLMLSWPHTLYMYVSGRFPEATAEAAGYCNFTTKARVVLVQAYDEVIMAMSAFHQGDREGAIQHMNTVFSLVMPDKFIMVFAEFISHLDKRTLEPFIIDSKAKAQLKRMAAYYRENITTMYKAISSGGLTASDLTDREHDVARLAAQGLTNKEIAAQLSVSVNTVKTHLASVFYKLSLSRRSDLINAINAKADML